MKKRKRKKTKDMTEEEKKRRADADFSWWGQFKEDGWGLDTDEGNCIAMLITIAVIIYIVWTLIEILAHWLF